MARLDFGKNTTPSEKVAAATKKGYDTGKPSKDAVAGTAWKARPKASASGGGKIGVTFTKKTGKRK